jgi:peptidoglycan/xylan/chitin deacetylase (PgdA/CDA1 family)
MFRLILFFPFVAALAAIGPMAAAGRLPMDAAEGSGRITLPDGRPAIQFDASAPKDSFAEWDLPTPLGPGWHSVEVGFGPEQNTRKLVNVEWLDADGNPLLSVDAYHLPGRTGDLPVAVLGIFLDRPATTVRWRKNQARRMASAPLVSLEIKPGRSAFGKASIEAVKTSVVSGNVVFPRDLGGGLLRAVSTAPIALGWRQTDGKSFSTPAASETTVFLDADLSEIAVEGARDASLHLERRFEAKSPVDGSLLKRPIIPLVGPGNEELTIDVRGTGLDSQAVAMADFPGGARMAAVQSWDDGIPQDRRLAELLHKTGWRASFFFNQPSPMLDRWKELEDFGMEVGSHSWSHPAYWLQTPRRCHEESLAMRILLEGRVGHPVISFAYPFNYGAAYDARGNYVLRAQREAGYLSCRSTMTGTLSLDDPGDPLAMKTDGHFLMPRDRIEAAWKRAAGTERGVFYLWGHSYELPGEADWAALENLLEKFGRRPEAWYASQGDLMVWKWMRENVKLSASGGATRLVVRLERGALHPWWAARVPVAVQVPGRITAATLDGRALPVVNGQIQIDWRK